MTGKRKNEEPGKTGVPVMNFSPGLENIVHSIVDGSCLRYDGIVNLKGQEREFTAYWMNDKLIRVDIKKKYNR